jgi:hypothetical protein
MLVGFCGGEVTVSELDLPRSDKGNVSFDHLKADKRSVSFVARKVLTKISHLHVQ